MRRISAPSSIAGIWNGKPKYREIRLSVLERIGRSFLLPEFRMEELLVKKYDVTLTLSKKRIPVYADSYEEAMAQVGELLAGLALMDFKEEEVESILVNGPDTANALPESATDQRTSKQKIKSRHVSSDMNKLCETLENLCLDSGYEEDEIEEELDNISSIEDFEPLLHWNFEPVCGLEVEGSEDIFPHHRNRLFGKNGYLLDDSLGSGVSAMSSVTESYELWLLEDMSLAVTFCCTMVVEGENGYFESVTFRFQVSGSYPELSGDFDAVDFLRSIEDRICDALNLD